MKPHVILITGPAGAGKTTITKKLAEKIPQTAVLEVDMLRRSIKNGYVHPFPYTEEAGKQILLGARNAVSLTKNFLTEDFNVLIDDVASGTILEFYWDQLKDEKFSVFLLLPDKKTLEKRDKGRGEDFRMGGRALELHDKFTERAKTEERWHVLDTTFQKEGETVHSILGILG